MHFIKYIPFILVGIAAIIAVYQIFTKDHLIKWFLQTLQENGKPSGKALAAFGCINSVILGFYISMYYSENHQPLEWYTWLMAGLATSFYGIREVGRFITTKFGTPGTTGTPDTPGASDVSEPTGLIEQTDQPQSPIKNTVPQSKGVDLSGKGNNEILNDEIG